MTHKDEKVCILRFSGAEGKGWNEEVQIGGREGEICHVRAEPRRMSQKAVHDCVGASEYSRQKIKRGIPPPASVFMWGLQELIGVGRWLARQIGD